MTCHGDSTTYRTVEVTYDGRGRLHDPDTGFTWSRGQTHEIATCDFERLWDAGKTVIAGKEHRRVNRPTAEDPARGDDPDTGIATPAVTEHEHTDDTQEDDDAGA